MLGLVFGGATLHDPANQTVRTSMDGGSLNVAGQFGLPYGTEDAHRLALITIGCGSWIFCDWNQSRSVCGGDLAPSGATASSLI